MVRNFLTLEETDLLFIQSLPEEQLYELICLYNLYSIMINYYI